VSVADHTGWAHLVCVAARGNVPAVIARRRVALIDQGLPTQPYEHETAVMIEDEASCSPTTNPADDAGRITSATDCHSSIPSLCRRGINAMRS
jgi:uncharacterized protein YraI